MRAALKNNAKVFDTSGAVADNPEDNVEMCALKASK